MTDCKNCSYRKYLARAFDIHVWEEDCDKYGSIICEALNKPIADTFPDGVKTITVRNLSTEVHKYGGWKVDDR